MSGALSGPLLACCWQPGVSLEWRGRTLYTELSRTDATGLSYRPAADPADPSKVLSFSYASGASRSETGTDSNRRSLLLQTFTNSDVFFRDDTITVVATFRMYGEAGGTAKDGGIQSIICQGSFTNFRVTASYVLEVLGPDLKLRPIGDPTIDQLGVISADDLTPNSSLTRMVANSVAFAQRSFSESTAFVTNFATSVETILNGHGWVFPGGNTFAFKDARFSPYQDLLATLTYREVTTPTLSTR